MGGVYLRKHTITPSPLSMFAPNPIFQSRLSHKTRLLRRWRHEAIALYSLLLYLIGWPLSDDQWQPIAAILYRTFSVKSTNFVELLVFNPKALVLLRRVRCACTLVVKEFYLDFKNHKFVPDIWHIWLYFRRRLLSVQKSIYSNTVKYMHACIATLQI